MTEEEWMASTNPERMMVFLHGKVSDRKRNLCAIAAVRRVWTAMAAEGNPITPSTFYSTRACRIHREAEVYLIHDICGNPFRTTPLDPHWLTYQVRHLAEGIYANCVFDSLPILADALEDAGCTNADILNHCRQPGDHVRGCWVVDLLLGKE